MFHGNCCKPFVSPLSMRSHFRAEFCALCHLILWRTERRVVSTQVTTSARKNTTNLIEILNQIRDTDKRKAAIAGFLEERLESEKKLALAEERLESEKKLALAEERLESEKKLALAEERLESEKKSWRWRRKGWSQRRSWRRKG